MPRYSAMKAFDCPYEQFVLKRKSLRRELAAQDRLQEIRIAVLGGSTTQELVNFWDVLLLEAGFSPTFYQSEYGRYYEDTVVDSEIVVQFRPDIVYLHTSALDIKTHPPISCHENDLESFVAAEMARWQEIWGSLEEGLPCQIIQNNFDPPAYSVLGNLDAVTPGGNRRFIAELNRQFAIEAGTRPNLLIQDLNKIAGDLGRENWLDWERYFNYKILFRGPANLEIARSLTAMLRAMYGRSSKVLVLDLDNTIWGGVIGDDGVDKIQIGKETPVAEAYSAFQGYCAALKERGVLLAVCSKNEHEAALSGLRHPSGVLREKDISCMKSNWEPKSDNIREIASELNLALDSLVFIDDNPAERLIVREQIPQVAVPEVGNEVSLFPAIIDRGRYFETIALSSEDISRSSMYAQNAARAVEQQKYATYGDYLDSLGMTAEIDSFRPVYLDRITQLTNKTNQFNLTTRRYGFVEMEELYRDTHFITLYGRLTDRFGDNGLISVIIGSLRDDALHIELWLMSCRVLKRDMELAMLDALVLRARKAGTRRLIGYYRPTAKNAIVAGHYAALGFARVDGVDGLPEGSTVWSLDIADYRPRNSHIRVEENVDA